MFAATGGRPFNVEQPAALFLHGAGMDHTVWSLQSRYFAYHERSVLSVDFPGHGRSAGPALEEIGMMADWVDALLESCGLETAVLVGHSMGVLVALECAVRYPQRVRSLSLLGAAGKMPVHPDLLESARLDDPLAFDLVCAWGHGPRGHLGGSPVPGMSLIGGGRSLLASAPKGVLWNDLRACDEYREGLDSAAKVECPALCVIGSEDRMTPPAKGRELAEAIPGCRVVQVHGAGHMMMIEDSRATLEALKSNV